MGKERARPAARRAFPVKRRVTMQDIANALGVSRATVWKAFNGQGGVSQELTGQILDIAKEMGYHREPARARGLARAMPADMTVSVIVSRPESSMFWMSIIHRAAKELAKRRINLMYSYVPSRYEADYQLPAALSDGTVRGAIVLNVYDERMLRLIDTLDIPKVYYDTVTAIDPYTLRGDVVLLEGRETVRRITDQIVRAGARRVGFLGDTAYARTNADRYEGYLQALRAHQIAPQPELCLTGPIEVGRYFEQISAFLNGLKSMPQAFVCASDHVAHYLYRYLAEKGLAVPGDLMVSGYDGSPEYENVSGAITTATVQTASLGKRLVQQLLMRLDNPGMPFELIYIYPQVVFGASTRP